MPSNSNAPSICHIHKIMIMIKNFSPSELVSLYSISLFQSCWQSISYVLEVYRYLSAGRWEGGGGESGFGAEKSFAPRKKSNQPFLQPLQNIACILPQQSTRALQWLSSLKNKLSCPLQGQYGDAAVNRLEANYVTTTRDYHQRFRSAFQEIAFLVVSFCRI